jgi:hypothetical protein
MLVPKVAVACGDGPMHTGKRNAAATGEAVAESARHSSDLWPE